MNHLDTSAVPPPDFRGGDYRGQPDYSGVSEPIAVPESPVPSKSVPPHVKVEPHVEVTMESASSAESPVRPPANAVPPPAPPALAPEPAPVPVAATPPPPPPRATLSPVRPPDPVPAAAPLTVSTQDMRSAAGPISERTVAPEAKPITQGTVATPSTKPSRWRTDKSAVAAEAKAAAAEGKPFEPVRREMPSWLISMIIHTIALLILALWTTPLAKGISRVVLEFGEATEESPVELDTFSIESSESLVDNAEADQEMPIDINFESDMQSLMSEELVMDPPMEIGLGPTVATEAMPMFAGRSGETKKALLATYGGTAETVEAVDRGLRWLARQQNKRDGSWSMQGPYDDGSYSENHTAATAMALLAFMGDGHTHRGDTEYTAVVDKGINYLLKHQQKRNGFFAGSAIRDERAYAQAQATIAICEAYALTKDSKLRGPAQAALDYAEYAQAPEGGWRYEPRFDSDLSVTGWFLMGLISGKAAGLDVDTSTLNQVTNYLNDIQTYQGAGYGYQRGRPASPAMTAEGLLCRQYLGWPKNHPAMAEGIDILVTDWPISPRNRNVYYWYYATQVLHHYGGSPWVQWNNVMRDELPRIQVKKGSEAGSWSPQGDQWGDSAGRLFTTCLSIYCLEVYYRHLPLYKMK